MLFRSTLPPEVLDKPKQGFEAPVKRWLRSELRDMAGDLLLDARSAQRGFFDPGAVKQLWADHVDGTREAGHQLWMLLILELWFRAFVDARPGLRP